MFSKISNVQLKQTVRVQFVSLLGLEEVGIDQKGVFKEFLEETCKMAFDNGLNLFQRTSEGCISVSPCSRIEDNYLEIFFYLGRILGKALYDGIILDIPFAQFVYSKFLGRYNYLVSSILKTRAHQARKIYRRWIPSCIRT